MAYDEGLAERIREVFDGNPVNVRDKRMFGGIAFLIEGNMTVGVVGDDLLVRVGPDATGAALARPGSRPFDMTGRAMTGWVVVDGGTLDDEVLIGWITQAREYVATLPPK
jgi:TfoX/Sxy family transcriptional regulator of competence genes